MDDPLTVTYMTDLLIKSYRQWKHELHVHFKGFSSAVEALANPPMELVERSDQWRFLCDHFMSPSFLVRFIILRL